MKEEIYLFEGIKYKLIFHMNINILSAEHYEIKGRVTAAAGITEEIKKLEYILETTDIKNEEMDNYGKLHELVCFAYNPIFKRYIQDKNNPNMPYRKNLDKLVQKFENTKNT